MLNDVNISACMPLRVSNPCSRKRWGQDGPINRVTGPERSPVIRSQIEGSIVEASSAGLLHRQGINPFYWMIAGKSSQAARRLAAALDAVGRSRAVLSIEILLVESLVGRVGALGAIELICTIASDDLQQARKGKESCLVRNSLERKLFSSQAESCAQSFTKCLSIS